MKKIDIENYISSYLKEHPLTLVDILAKRYTIDSYEEYISTFKLVYNTYKDNIVEYSEEAKEQIEHMDSFIDAVLANTTDENVENYIFSKLLSSLAYSSYDRLRTFKFIHPNSFLVQLECSKEAFINVYDELGYDNLQNYINLVKTPSNFSSYINDTTKQIVAMKFLLYKTDHHSPTKFKRNTSSKTIYEMSAAQISETLDSITQNKDDYITYMDEQKKAYNEWFDNTALETQDFIDNHNTKLENIEKTYKEKLKVSEPAKFMKEQADKYKNSYYLWCLGVGALSLLLLLLLAIVVSPDIAFNDKIITVTLLNKDMPVYSSIILLAMISLVIYLLRVFIKMAVSSRHLMEEYKQKYALTYFYLSLVSDGKLNDDKTQNIILASLFNKADTGLIKNDNSSDFDLATLLTLINKQ